MSFDSTNSTFLYQIIWTYTKLERIDQKSWIPKKNILKMALSWHDLCVWDLLGFNLPQAHISSDFWTHCVRVCECVCVCVEGASGNLLQGYQGECPPLSSSLSLSLSLSNQTTHLYMYIHNKQGQLYPRIAQPQAEKKLLYTGEMFIIHVVLCREVGDTRLVLTLVLKVA